MKCTILGTGPSEGVPAPLCDCDYCEKNSRKRPSILVSKDDKNIVFDASPDIRRQLESAGLVDIDAIFLTHFHFDHSNGIRELNNTTVDLRKLGVHDEVTDAVRDNLGKSYDVYSSAFTEASLRDEIGYAVDSEGFRLNTIEDNDEISVGNLTVTPFIAEHCHGYLGFKISDGDRTIVYHPDHGTIRTEVEFEDVDVLVYDASAFLGYEVHGTQEDFHSTIDKINADEIYFTNVSEHVAQKDSDRLQDMVPTGSIVEDNMVL